MPSMDIFKDEAFSMQSLAVAAEKLPHQPTRIRDLGLFSFEPVATTSIMVEELDGKLSLIADTPRGAPASQLTGEKRKVRTFRATHLTRESTVTAESIQNVRAFGSETDLELVQRIVQRRQARLMAQHDVTLEHLRMGALKGIILDADGVTPLFNLFTEFEVAQQTQDFVFSVATTNIRNACTAVLRKIEDELGAAVYTGVRAFCSPEWFDALASHAKVEEAFKYQEGQMLREDLRRGFAFGGITFEEYRGTVGGVKFVEADVAYAFPEGALLEGEPLFQNFWSPADFMETANTLGREFYAKIATDPEFNRWAKVHSQSNPLPLCLKPRAVVKLTKS